MPGPDPAVAASRCAARDHLGDVPAGGLVLVACSGGADSLALAAAAAFEGPRAGVRVGALIVDHGLQAGSADAAGRAAKQCRALGLDPVRVCRVDVAAAGGGGPEARARDARYAALREGADALGAHAVWLGHTRDDQAEQVLLGLARGSGTRSLAGMARRRPPYERPFLHLPAATTRAACAAQGLRPWADPSNDDPRYLRNRARRALADLEADLGPGFAAALARTADLARADADHLDALAEQARDALGEGPWPVEALAAHPPAVRTRLLRLLVTAAAPGAAAPTSAHLAAIDALITRWRGQGPTFLPGGVAVSREGDAVRLRPPRGGE